MVLFEHSKCMLSCVGPEVLQAMHLELVAPVRLIPGELQLYWLPVHLCTYKNVNVLYFSHKLNASCKQIFYDATRVIHFPRQTFTCPINSNVIFTIIRVYHIHENFWYDVKQYLQKTFPLTFIIQHRVEH